MCCGCEVTELFYAVRLVVTSVHKIDFRFVLNEIPNKWGVCICFKNYVM